MPPRPKMMLQIAIEPVFADEREVLWRYLQFYIYDMSQFTGARPNKGVFAYSPFEGYWQGDERRTAWWVKLGGEIAGFALVRVDECDGRRELAEFFILNRWRRRGAGLAFARALLARWPGPWKLHELANNSGAIAFWRQVLEGFARYSEVHRDHPDGIGRIEQCFDVS